MARRNLCSLYGKPQMKNVNDLRYATFQQHYVFKKQDKQLDGIKGMNPSNVPPCQSVNKLSSAVYIHLAYVWKHAHLTNPCTAPPKDNDWVLQGNKYNMNWFNCDQLPQEIIY